MVGVHDGAPTFDFITTTGTVYYRLYLADEAVASKLPVYSNNEYIGRIDATCVSPPHTAGTISRFIAKREGITNPIALFSTISNPAPTNDQDLLAIFTGTGPGSAPQDPVALVMIDSQSSGTMKEIKEAIREIKDGVYFI
jgi:hypothetical protein